MEQLTFCSILSSSCETILTSREVNQVQFNRLKLIQQDEQKGSIVLWDIHYDSIIHLAICSIVPCTLHSIGQLKTLFQNTFNYLHSNFLQRSCFICSKTTDQLLNLTISNSTTIKFQVHQIHRINSVCQLGSFHSSLP